MREGTILVLGRYRITEILILSGSTTQTSILCGRLSFTRGWTPPWKWLCEFLLKMLQRGADLNSFSAEEDKISPSQGVGGRRQDKNDQERQNPWPFCSSVLVNMTVVHVICQRVRLGLAPAWQQIWLMESML